MHSRHPLAWYVALLACCFVPLAASAGCGDDTTSGTSNAGGAGEGGQGSGASPGVGGSSGCSIPEDCPTPDSDCVERTCNAAGVCGTKVKASGTPIESQIEGDCHVDVCDGVGGIQTEVDDTDSPDDQNACTADSCDEGVEKYDPLPAGTECGVTGICDPTGACIECNSPADCPGADTECRTKTCVGNVCGVLSVTKGTPLAIQVDGNCQVDQCDGNGGTETANDDLDLPDDFNECTNDLCTAGVPSHVPLSGGACGVGLTCDNAGHCIGCVSPSECGVDDPCKQRTCVSSTCGFTFTPDGTAVPSQIPGDCKEQQCDGTGGVKDVAANTDVPVDGNECTDDVCTTGAPSNPPAALGTACNGADVCNATGQCVECNSAPDCPPPPPGNPCLVATCASNLCGVGNAPAGTECGPASCTGDTGHEADACDAAGVCQPGATAPCAPYICGPSACTDSCVNDNDCASGNVCDTGISRCIPTGAPKCTDYCTVIGTNCTGTTFAMYSSSAACLAVCAALPIGATNDQDGNTVGCRLYHAGAAAGGADPHCGHAGPAGESQCGVDNCESFCIIAEAVCTGANQQYASTSACLAECNGFAETPKYNASFTTGDSFACRLYHLTAASLLPNVHCEHIVEDSSACF